MGQIAQAGVENALAPSDQPLIQVYQVDDSVESLPISEDPILLSIHFTQPAQTVDYVGSPGVIDIASESFGDEEGAGSLVTIGAG